MTPEEEARQEINELLEAAEWKVLDYRKINFGVALSVAVREFPLIRPALLIICFLLTVEQWA